MSDQAREKSGGGDQPRVAGLPVVLGEPKKRSTSERYRRKIGHLKRELERVEDFCVDLLGVIDANALKLPPPIDRERHDLEFPLPGEID